ncbi:baseplate J/gp47 family protein [Hymenobacter chitinivorans]|uniref:Baseplate J-like protein n=1 Tax=Hymenobacter chitinivorans DSM 11115 TaxID=1121954 RepID=A0A2M9BS59_9BACT|nr:baseplate J/gp47 family protein [Hymenobacter chitinivorans]PJJ60783.1 baseplate J-like protein [Hymenobacter chitinivorans DSM 11115]
MSTPAPDFPSSKHHSHLQSGGVSQHARLLPDLLPGHLELDARQPEDLLAYITRFSDVVRYYRVAEDQLIADGFWSLEHHRSTLILAVIAVQPVKTQAENYAALIRQLRDKSSDTDRQRRALQRLFAAIGSMATTLNKWYEYHRMAGLHLVFQGELEEAIDKLAPVLRSAALYEAVLARLKVVRRTTLTEEFLQDFNLRSWHHAQAALTWLDPAEVEALHQQLLRHALQPATVVDELLDLLRKFQNTQIHLANLARKTLRHGSESKGDYLPEIGLLLTFTRLYTYAQRALNHIPARHLDYYYRQVLRTEPRGAVVPHSYASFELIKGSRAVRVPAGLLVEGAKDAAGQRTFFRTAEEQTLTPWRLETLSTLHVARASAAPGAPVTGIYLAPVANSADGLGLQPVKSQVGWPLFGEDQALKSRQYRTMPDAELGFAVASPVLLLQEGHRSIQLRLHCSAADIKTLGLLLFVANAHWATTNAQRAGHWVAAFERLGVAAFQASITGATGWQALTIKTLTLDQAQNTVTWLFTLDAGRPAVVGYQPELHTGRYATTQPVLKLVLNPGVSEYGYSFFAALRPRKIQLLVAARHVQGLLLGNQLGRLDASKPFYPFGTSVRQGSYLQVGLPELYAKRVTKLTLLIDWLQLPTEPGGFAEYYRGYTPPVANDSFKVEASFRSGWQWVPSLPQRKRYALFQPEPTATRQLRNCTQLELTPVGAGHGAATDAGPLHDPGYVRLELREPAMGFGDDQYPLLLADTLQHNVRNSPKRPLPRAPFAPLVKTLKLSYQAEDELDMALLARSQSGGHQHFFHLHPLAEYEPVRLLGQSSADNHLVPLLPEFAGEGCLYLGLSNLTPGATINLLFVLHPQSRTITSAQDFPPVSWSYLADNQWISFVPGHTLRDTSQGFTHLGQTYLTLPEILDTNHAVMPSGLFWVRAQVPGNTKLFSHVQAVHPQLVRVVQELPDPLPLPPKSLLGVATVRLPLPWLGGRDAEDEAAYYTRVSERLRHRNRALTPWDYERIVLAQFPEVHSVKCLTAQQVRRLGYAPGRVVLAVLPHQHALSESGEPATTWPFFSAAQLLRIRNWVQALASPHLEVEVRNPQYEVLTVRCQILYKSVRQQFDQSLQLHRDLAEFLSPWGLNEALRGGFHDHFHTSLISSFINQRPYVDRIWGFSLIKTGLVDERYRYYDSATFQEQDDVEIRADWPWTVFVPAQRHYLEIKTQKEWAAPQTTGIGDLRIEEGFTIGLHFDHEPGPGAAAAL